MCDVKSALKVNSDVKSLLKVRSAFKSRNAGTITFPAAQTSPTYSKFASQKLDSVEDVAEPVSVETETQTNLAHRKSF